MTTRVLVVDDAVVVRRLVTQVLEQEPDLEVTTAANGRIALARIGQHRPDIVLLDVEMPELDGLGTLRELRASDPHLPVVMFSTLTERGAATTIEAMALGATDYVTKPANVGSVAASMEAVRTELVPKIRALCAPRTPAPPVLPVPPATHRRRPPGRVDLVVVGCSTGGPRALHELLAHLPADLAVPVVVVQHMPPVFTRLLAERLDATCPLPVHEARGGEALAGAAVWVAPGGHHLRIEGHRGQASLAIDDGPRENSCRPAVDVLFRSAAAAYGATVLGVVLTGMGADGARGAELLREAGSSVVVQDEPSSVVWGMPGAVVRAGHADDVLPLSALAAEICARVGVGRSLARAEV